MVDVRMAYTVMAYIVMTHMGMPCIDSSVESAAAVASRMRCKGTRCPVLNGSEAAAGMRECTKLGKAQRAGALAPAGPVFVLAETLMRFSRSR